MSIVEELDMPVDRDPSEEIFLGALSKPDAAARLTYLNEACGEDVSLRQRVEALLAAHNATSNFLELPKSDAAFFAALAEGPGSKIGWYKLLEQIGEGGMGTVYMAQQIEPVSRKVALKIVKPGMDSRLIIARFEAERQALALMDHQNIARMLDAGTTDTGRPYFVMELVKGVSIVQYCDQHRLPTRERLELFITVCQAIQHAHQKGIIHRDLKPNNILVAEHDDHPVAKIIDFGVAKAVGQPLTERTMFTEFGQVVGTIEYMSPEQAKLNQLDIDTRSDIYSLGVLLYELLSGETPFDRQRLRAAAFDEMLRIIREEEPLTPSARLSTSQSLASIANNRQLEPRKLGALVSGDLDWIVMRCLEKDRSRRYPTAIGLAEDLQHYLADEPVAARKPSRVYRLKKFIRRNKFSVVAGSAIGAALAMGLILASIGFVQARHQADAADRANRYLRQMLGEGNFKTPDNISSAWLYDISATRALAEHNYKGALDCERMCLAILKKIFPLDHGTIEFSRENMFHILHTAADNRALATACSTAEELADIELIFHELTKTRVNEGSADLNPFNAIRYALVEYPVLYLRLADEMEAAGNRGEADKCRERAESSFQESEIEFAGQPLLLGAVYRKQAVEYTKQGQREQARIKCRKLLALTSFDEAPLNRFAWLLATDEIVAHRDPEMAVEIAQKAVQISPGNADHWNTLGVALYRAGQWQAAIDALNKSEDLLQPDPSFDWLFLAMADWQLGRKDEARQWYEKAVKSMDENRPNDEELKRFRDEAAMLLGINPSQSTVNSQR